jgi:hypothetical protein
MTWPPELSAEPLIRRFLNEHPLQNVDIRYQRLLSSDVFYQKKDDDRWEVLVTVNVMRYTIGMPMVLLMLADILGHEHPWFTAPKIDDVRKFGKAHLAKYQIDGDSTEAQGYMQDMLRFAGTIRQAFGMSYLLSKNYVSPEEARELAKYGAGSPFFSNQVEFLCTMAALRANDTDTQLLEGELLKSKQYNMLRAIDIVEESIKQKKFSCDTVGNLFDEVFNMHHNVRSNEPFEDIVQRVLGRPNKADLDYDVAISYATDDSPIVKPLADLFREKGIKVFFDEYEKANLWGKDLYGHLSDIYSRRARFCLMVVSRHYASKQWTNIERKAAQSRALQEHAEYILPLRLDDTEVPGLVSTTGYIDYRKTSLEAILHLMVEKLSQYS